MRCRIRALRDEDRGMLLLLAEETLHPLAEGAGHPERYRSADVLALLDRADVFVAEVHGETAGFVAVEQEGDALVVRCVSVNPGFEGRGVADRLVEWAEGVAIERRLHSLTALVPAADNPSLHLYTGQGFVGREAPGRQDMLTLEKRLPLAEG